MSASSTTSLGNSSARPDNALPNASRSESPLEPMSAGASDAIEILPDLFMRGTQRGERVIGLLAGELHAAVPGGHVLHVRHALALDGVGDDDARAVMRGAGAAEGLEQRGHVVAVDLGDRPVEGAPFRGQRLQPHDLVVARVALQLVVVDDGAEIVELVMRRAHRAFPYLALLQLAVAQERIDARGAVLELEPHPHIGDLPWKGLPNL